MILLKTLYCLFADQLTLAWLLFTILPIPNPYLHDKLPDQGALNYVSSVGIFWEIELTKYIYHVQVQRNWHSPVEFLVPSRTYEAINNGKPSCTWGITAILNNDTATHHASQLGWGSPVGIQWLVFTRYNAFHFKQKVSFWIGFWLFHLVLSKLQNGSSVLFGE